VRRTAVSTPALARLRGFILAPALLSALVTFGMIVTAKDGDPWLRVAGTGAVLLLAAHWTRRRFPLAGEVPETLALVVALLAVPGQPPLPLFGTIFRSLYGSLWLAQLRAVVWIGAIAGAALVHGSFDLEDQLGKAAGLLIAPPVMQMLARTITRLQRSELRLRALLEHSTDVVTIVDADSRVLWQAASVRDVLGYDPDAMTGHPLAALVHPDEADAFRLALSEHAPAPGENATLACHMRDATGSYRDIEANVGNRLHEEHIGGFLLTLRDVTEHRRQELQVREQRSLRLESIGQLAGGVAHDFNNLLAVILNCAAFLRDDLPEEHPSQQDVAQISESAERGARLVKQLLLFSRGESSAPQLVSFNTTLRAMDALLSHALPDNVRLRYDLEDDLPPVYADATNLEQVIVNLVVNARDAMGVNGGEIEISTVRFGDYVQLTVADDGCGMDAATVERAIEPFFTTKAFGEGTGLGLATVHGIARGAGGYLSIVSAPGEGTSISVHLPVQECSMHVDPLNDASLA
jgi:PAS domain S-box-containing protein